VPDDLAARSLGFFMNIPEDYMAFWEPIMEALANESGGGAGWNLLNGYMQTRQLMDEAHHQRLVDQGTLRGEDGTFRTKEQREAASQKSEDALAG
jgi:hypothetical protein